MTGAGCLKAFMDLKITLDKRTLKQFDEAMQKDVRFATAKALTVTASQASKRTREYLPKYFMIRNAWTKTGIDIERAEKKDWPNSKATVGSTRAYMVIQEEGGTKAPLSKAFAIPKGIRTSEKRLVPRSKWPGQILQGEMKIPGGGRTRGAKDGARNKPKAFLLHDHNGVGVYIRLGKGRKLKRLFRLTKESMHVRGKHWLMTPVTQVVEANLHNNFVEALDGALKTRRK